MTSIRKLKKLLKKQDEKKALPQVQPVEMPDVEAIAGEAVDKERQTIARQLLQLNNLISQTQDIARQRYSDNPEELLRIVLNQNASLEKLIEKYDIRVFRSARGDEFDPETMEADEVTVDTDNEELQDKVYCSIKPGYAKGDDIIEFERVRLYNYKKA